MTTRKFSTVAESLSDDAREAAHLAREIGFAGLLFDAYSSGLSIPGLSDTGRREFRHMLSSQAQALVGLRVDLRPKGLTPGADVDRLISQFDEVLRAGADLRADVVCVDLGPLPAPTETRAPKPNVTAEQAGTIIIPSTSQPPVAPESQSPPPDPTLVAHVDTALAALGDIAERYQTTLAFSSSLAAFAALERALRVVHCPWFGIDLDPVAILGDRWKIEEIFSRLGSTIRHVRARDALLGADQRTKPVEIGRGNVNWSEFFTMMDHAGYSGWITIDPQGLPHPRAAAEAGLSVLFKLVR